MTVIGMGRVIMGLSAGAAFFRICSTDPGCRASRHRPREEGRVLSVENETILHASPPRVWTALTRSEEHTSELRSLMRISYAVFCLKKKKKLIQQSAHA